MNINIIKKYLTKSIALVAITTSILAFNSMGASAACKQDDTNSFYIGEKPCGNGQMITLEDIDGCFVNSSGVYTNTITSDEARQLILKEDGSYIAKITDQYTRFSTDYREYSSDNMPGGNAWNIPKEPCYEFYMHVYDSNGENSFDLYEYLVGKESKNVYIAPNQGGMSIYQIKNNQKVKTFKYIGSGDSYEWR